MYVAIIGFLVLAAFVALLLKEKAIPTVVFIVLPIIAGLLVGYDIDIVVQFCQAYGYGLEIDVVNLDAVLPAIQSGKADIGASAITITLRTC